MKIRTLSHLKNLQGKIVFLRVDYNVAIVDGKIKDDYRLQASLATVNWLQEHGARLIIASHLGDPQGEIKAEYSLKPVALRLSKLLKKPVKFLKDVKGDRVKRAVAQMKAGEMVMLENLRFESGELSDDLNFAKELASLADIYVNDAFAVSHRQQASVAAIKKYLPAYAGLLIEAEVKALNKVLKPKKPLVVIMGGAKISTKAPLISKLYPIADTILVGGALANNFFKYQGREIGKSLFDKDSVTYVKKYFSKTKLKTKIILPVDVVVCDKKGKVRVCAPSGVKKTEAIFDIGPETIGLYAQYINKAQTLVWNGPLGKFEENSFKQGTLSTARLVATRSSGRAYGLIGGGETVAALNLTKMVEYVDWVSTAGGAMLSYLGGEEMPGLEKIISR
jgi:phosphoglycerate kinase